MEGNKKTHLRQPADTERMKKSKKKKKDKDIGGGNSSLPHDIIINDILTRVPIESLIRFRSVCKQWLNLILDPIFINLHSCRYSNYPLGFIGYSNNSNDISDGDNGDYDYDYDDDDEDDNDQGLGFYDLNKGKKLKVMLRLQYNDFVEGNMKIKILQSLNGLLLLYCKDRETRMSDYYVCNPITGQSEKVPLLEYMVSRKDRHVCLGYDSIKAKYKVVSRGDGDCKILTLGEDSWRDVVLRKPAQYYCVNENYRPVFANGSVHWMRSSIYVNDEAEPESDRQLVSVDVSSETLYTIRLPEHYLPSEGCYTLLEMGGLLCFVHYISATQLKLWVLKQQDLENHNSNHEWTEECSIDIGTHVKENILPVKGFLLESLDCVPFAILTRPRRKFIFWHLFDYEDGDHRGEMINCTRKYYSYDIESKQVDFIDETKGMEYHWHVISLAHPTLTLGTN